MLVAPREISDYVYRACRVRGLDEGPAQAVAANARLAQQVFADGLSLVVDGIASRDGPVIGDLVVACRLGQRAAPDATRRVDLVRVAVDHARLEQTLLVDGHPPAGWASASDGAESVDRIDIAEGAPRHWLAHVDDIVAASHASGVAVARGTWQRLQDLSSPYLVGEARLDAAENE